MQRFNRPQSWGRCRSIRLLTSTLFACAAIAASVQAQRLHTYTLTEATGLPDSRTVDIDQGPDGRIWIASRAGICAYDGSSFQEHLPDMGLSPEFVPERIATDATGAVWAIGTVPGQGLLRLGAGGWEVIATPPELASSAGVREIEVLERQGGQPRVVLSTLAGVHSWDGQAWSTIERPAALSAESILGMHAFEGDVYLATSAGLEVLREGTLATEVLLDLPDAAGGFDAVRAVRSAGGSLRLWIAGQGWLGLLEGGEFVRKVEVPSGFGMDVSKSVQLLEDGRGGAYMGTYLLLFHYDAQSGKIRRLGFKEGVASDGACSLLRDLDGNVWVCSLRGVTRIPPQSFASYGHDQGLYEDEVSAILELPSGRLVFGHEWGLSTMDPSGGVRTTSFSPPGEIGAKVGRIFDLCAAGGDEFWIAASDQGLGRATAAGEIEWMDEISKPVWCVAPGADGRLWVGASDGLWIREPNGVFSRDPALGMTPMRRILRLSDGSLYAAAMAEGLFVRREGTWATVQPRGDVQSEAIYCMFDGDRGTTWVGSNRGLFHLEGGELRRHLEGFRIDVPVYAGLADRAGDLWFGTAKGAMRWDGQELRRFGVREGLAGREVNRAALVQDAAGSVWIGTDGGVSRFLAPPTVTPRPVQVEILEMRWSDPGASRWGDHPIAGYSDLDVRVRAVSFEGAGDCTFRARLDGFDWDWLPERCVGDGELRYTNLPPGKYRLDVQARSEHGSWGPVTSSAPFTMSAPFWERGWFVGLGFSALGILIASLTGLLRARRRSAGLAVEVRVTHAALEGSEQRYGEIFERSPSILLLLAPDSGRVAAANDAAARYFGQSLESLRSLTLSELTGISEESFAGGREILAAGQEWIARPAQEEPVFGAPIEIRASQFSLAGQQTIQATIFDIEAQEREAQERLEAQKLRAVGELASSAAHDFNNLLTAILGHNELIELDAGEDERLKAHVAQIRSAGAQGARLVRQLLAFGRKHRLHVEELDLGQITREMAPLMQSVLSNALPLVLELGEADLTVRADRSELEEVLMNLALAVRDAAPDGAQLVVRGARISGHELPDGDGANNGLLAEYVRLELEVTPSAARRDGCLPPSLDILELGIHAAQELVAHWNGSVRTLRPSPAALHIEVFLPAVEEEPAGLRSSMGQPGEGVVDASGRTILVVDDELEVRRTIAALLRSDGYRALEAADATEARAILLEASGEIDLVLTDIQMPGESGRDLARSLRRTDPFLPVLYMSGYYDEALAAEGELFLSKPFSLTKFESTLRRAGLQLA